MKECLIRNLCDGPRDYPLIDGSSIYLGAKRSATGVARVNVDKVSEALRVAEDKGLVHIEELPAEKEVES